MRKNDQPISEIIQQMMKSSTKINTGLASVSIQKIYAEEMGDVINGYTEQIKLKGSTLIINVISAPLRAELMSGKEKMMTLLNKRLGSNIINKIIIR